MKFSKRLLLWASFLLLSCPGKAQNYDVLTDIIERNPEYKIEEYFEIALNENGEPMLVKVEKSILNGSQKETKHYFLGTPYFADQEWLPAEIKLPGQSPLRGYISFNQVFQTVSYKRNLNFPRGQIVQAEYIKLDSLTFYSYPEDDLLQNGYFVSQSFDGLILLKRLIKKQQNNPNANLQGYVINERKYEAKFVDAPEFYIVKSGETLRVEKNNYFVKAFGKDKKMVRKYLKSFPVNFESEADVKRFLSYLMK